jgi:hypothetical protein
MRRWARLRDLIDETDAKHNGKPWYFDNEWVAWKLGVSPREGSEIIQAYLAEQRHPESYVTKWIHREGRTRSTHWLVGLSPEQVEALGAQTMEDVMRRVAIAIAPDLDRARKLSPKTSKSCDKVLDAIEAALAELQVLNGKA